MNALFYISSAIAILATILVITRLNAVHALLYFIVSLLAVALIFFALGAPFVAALEVIIYAGAIMVLFIFVIMMLNLGSQAVQQEREWLSPQIWIGPSVLAVLLVAELVYVLGTAVPGRIALQEVGPKQVALSLLGPYLVATELASILLLAGLIGAFHLGRRERPRPPKRGNP